MENFFKDIFSTFRSRLVNPFFFSLILVWSFRNWEFFYYIFNSSRTSDGYYDGLFFYHRYVDATNLWLELIICAGLSLVTVLVSLLFLNIVRFLVGVSKEIVEPFISGVLFKKGLVTKEKHKILRDEFKKLEEENDELMEQNLKFNNHHDELEEKVDDLEDSLENEVQQHSVCKAHNESLKIELKNKEEQLKAQLDELKSKYSTQSLLFVERSTFDLLQIIGKRLVKLIRSESIIQDHEMSNWDKLVYNSFIPVSNKLTKNEIEYLMNNRDVYLGYRLLRTLYYKANDALFSNPKMQDILSDYMKTITELKSQGLKQYEFEQNNERIIITKNKTDDLKKFFSFVQQ